MNPKITTARVEAILEHGVDVEGRRVFMHGDVDEETVGLAIRGLYLLDGVDGREPVTLFVSSYGGSLDDAFALHDVTRTVRCPVHTVALGKCQSAAPMLVACGHPGERWAGESTRFMLHDASLWFDEGESASPEEVAIFAHEGALAMKRYAGLLARYTKKKDARFWSRLFARKSDSYFDAHEALEWGIVDAIWDQKEGTP